MTFIKSNLLATIKDKEGDHGFNISKFIGTVLR